MTPFWGTYVFVCMGNTKGVRRDFEALEKRRFKAIRLVEQGCSQSETARRLKVARQSVSEWLRRYRRDGEAGLRQAGRTPLAMLADPTAHALLRRLHPPCCLGLTQTFVNDQPHGLQPSPLESIKIASYASWVPHVC